MKTKGKKDGLSKEGSSRVSMFQQTGFLRCYTLEANYNTMAITNRITPIDLDAPYPVMCVDQLPAAFPHHRPDSLSSFMPKFIPEMYHDIGRALVVATLEMYSINPRSRLPFTSFQSVTGVQTWIERHMKLLVSLTNPNKSAQALKNIRQTLQDCGAPSRQTIHCTEVAPAKPRPSIMLSASATGSRSGELPGTAPSETNSCDAASLAAKSSLPLPRRALTFSDAQGKPKPKAVAEAQTPPPSPATAKAILRTMTNTSLPLTRRPPASRAMSLSAKHIKALPPMATLRRAGSVQLGPLPNAAGDMRQPVDILRSCSPSLQPGPNFSKPS